MQAKQTKRTEKNSMKGGTGLAAPVSDDHLPICSTPSASNAVFALQSGLDGDGNLSNNSVVDDAQAMISVSSEQTSFTCLPSTFSWSSDSNCSTQTMDFVLFRPSLHWPDGSPGLSMQTSNAAMGEGSAALGRAEARIDLYKEGYHRQLQRSRRSARENAELNIRIEALERLHISSLEDQAKLHGAVLQAQSLMNEARAYAREVYERNMQLEGKVLSMEYHDRLNKLAIDDQTRVYSKLKSTSKQIAISKSREEHMSLMLQAHNTMDEEAEYACAVLMSLDSEKSDQIENLQRLVKQDCTSASGESWEKQLESLHEHLQSVEQDRKDLQRQTWTQKHLLEEGERALVLSQHMHQKAEEERALAVDELKSCRFELRVHKTVSEQIVGDYMRRLAEKEQEMALLTDRAEGDPTAMGHLTEQCVDLTRQVATARAAQTGLEREVEAERDLRAASEEKIAASEKHARLTDAEMRKMEMELHGAQEDISTIREANGNLLHQLAFVGSQADVWQTVAEEKLIALQPETLIRHEEYIVQRLRRQLVEVGGQLSDAEADRDRYHTERDDLRYEVSLYQRCALQTYEPAGFKWFEKWVDAFVEAQVLRTYFAQELADSPLEIPKVPVSTEDFLTACESDQEQRSEQILQEVAYERGMGHTSSESLEPKCDTDRIAGIYGFGPAGPPDVEVYEKPAGYDERRQVEQDAAEEDLAMSADGDETGALVEEGWEDVEEIEDMDNDGSLVG